MLMVNSLSGFNPSQYEEGRTNNLTRSGDLTNAAWVKFRLSFAATGGTAPDGAGTWQVGTEDGLTDLHNVYQGPITISAGSTNTLSTFIKAGTRRYVLVEINGSATVFAGVAVDTTNWTVTNYVGSGGGVVLRSGLRRISSGVYRVFVTGTIGSITSAYPAFSGATSTAPSSGVNTSYAGGSTIILWGQQFELGPFMTSYIATTSSTVTRSARIRPWAAL